MNSLILLRTMVFDLVVGLNEKLGYIESAAPLKDDDLHKDILESMEMVDDVSLSLFGKKAFELREELEKAESEGQ